MPVNANIIIAFKLSRMMYSLTIMRIGFAKCDKGRGVGCGNGGLPSGSCSFRLSMAFPTDAQLIAMITVAKT